MGEFVVVAAAAESAGDLVVAGSDGDSFCGWAKKFGLVKLLKVDGVWNFIRKSREKLKRSISVALTFKGLTKHKHNSFPHDG